MGLRQTLTLAGAIALETMGCGGSQPSPEISNIAGQVSEATKVAEGGTELPRVGTLDNEGLMKTYNSALQELTTGDYKKGKELFETAWVNLGLSEMAMDAGDAATNRGMYQDALDFYKRALLATDDETVKADAAKKISEAEALIEMGKPQPEGIQ